MLCGIMMEKIIRKIIKDTIAEITVPIKWDRYTEYEPESEPTGLEAGGRFVINLFGWIMNPLIWVSPFDPRREDFILIRFVGSVEPLEISYEYNTSSANYCDQIAKELGYTKETHHLCNKWEA